MEINSCVKVSQKSFDTFIRCVEASDADLSFQANYLCDNAYRVSAALQEDAAASGFFATGYAAANAVFASATGASLSAYMGNSKDQRGEAMAPAGQGEATVLKQLSRSESFTAFIGLEHVDVWLALQLYVAEVRTVGTQLLAYNDFKDKQIRTLKKLTETLQKLMQSTMHIYIDERLRVWQDSARFLSTAHAAFAAKELPLPEPVAVAGGHTHAGSVIGGSRSAAATLFESVDQRESEDDHTEPSSPQLEFVSCVLKKFEADFSPASFPSESFIAYHGPLTYCTVSSSSSGGFSNSSSGAVGSGEAGAGAGAGAVRITNKGGGGDHASAAAAAAGLIAREELTEHSLWADAYVVVTFNRIIHILKPPCADEDSFVFSEERLLLSINARDAKIGHVFIPKEGYRDAFEVIPTEEKRSATTLDNIMMNAASTVGVGTTNMSHWAVKDVGSVVFLADNALLVRNWMRAITNPFADPNIDPPYPDTAAIHGSGATGVANESNLELSIRAMRSTGEDISGVNMMNSAASSSSSTAAVGSATTAAAQAGAVGGKGTRTNFVASSNNTIGSGSFDDELVVEGANPQRAALLRSKSRKNSVNYIAQTDLVVSGENPLR